MTNLIVCQDLLFQACFNPPETSPVFSGNRPQNRAGREKLIDWLLKGDQVSPHPRNANFLPPLPAVLSELFTNWFALKVVCGVFSWDF